MKANTNSHQNSYGQMPPWKHGNLSSKPRNFYRGRTYEQNRSYEQNNFKIGVGLFTTASGHEEITKEADKKNSQEN